MRVSKKLLTILSISMLLLLFLIPEKMTQASPRQGSICILYQGRTKKDTTISLSNANFVIYNVGYEENGRWTLNNNFKRSYVSLENDSAQSRQKQAKSLYQYGKKQKIQRRDGKTNQSGRLVFGQLENGLYLVAQTKEVIYGETESYISDPFLVSIPADVDGTLLYHVTAEPKSAWENNKKIKASKVKKEKVDKKDVRDHKKTNFTSIVKTGDFKNPWLWILAIMMSSFITGIAIKIQQKNK